jgi:hypothetical protein
MKVHEPAVGLAIRSQRRVGQATVDPGGIASLHAAYHSQALDCWRYEQGDGIAMPQKLPPGPLAGEMTLRRRCRCFSRVAD